ncbi:hypothetical protein SAMN05661010_00983 [Modicisalibacter muralis]|uniref:Uncharacterized protein n=1 Tax=Modicisalibacter muralis TaxID=119000 RepID=A0A1G9HZ98_9GAMM|nr:hypothetical protein [Halomonas muralis]SDL18299.1 hypothetical protein SAMN05661010_00983 [Halomonas muralis]
MLGFFVGMVMYAPAILGMFILPWVLWRRLDQRFLEKRGVPFWEKAIVYTIIAMPLFVTLQIQDVVMKGFHIYPTDYEIRKAREFRPRAIPFSSFLPYILGLVASHFLIPAAVKVYLPSLSNRFSSLLNKLSGDKRVIQESRAWPCELHCFERAIEKTIQPSRYKQHYEPRLITKEFGYKKSSIEMCDLLLKSFLHAQFIVVLRRRVVGRKLVRRDLYRVKSTVIIAEDEDCLGGIHSRAPVAKISGNDLAKLMDKHWGILVHQPKFSALIGEDMMNKLRVLQL